MTRQRTGARTSVVPSPAGAGGSQPVLAMGSDRARGYVGTPPLPDEPAVTASDPHSGALAPPPTRVRPLVGLAGLTFVAPLFFLLAFGAGGSVNSLQILAPLTTFALPVIAMIAFWWEDWPGSTWRAGWSGLTDTLIIMAGGVGFTLLGQAVVAGFDVKALFDAEPGTGHVETFPHTMPLAAGVFTAILQLTLVSEGWPLRRLGRLVSGLAALVMACGVGLAGYLLLVGTAPTAGGLRDPGGPVGPGAYGAWLTALGAWQVLFFVGVRGWPFTMIRRRAVRLPVANAAVIVCGWGTYLIMRHAAGRPAEQVTAICGCVIAAVLLVAMLFDAWPWIRLKPLPGRGGVVITSLVVAGLLYWALNSYADTVDWGRSHPEDWVAYSALNALGMSIILHVAIWKRWPVVVGTDGEPPATRHTGPQPDPVPLADTEPR